MRRYLNIILAFLIVLSCARSSQESIVTKSVATNRDDSICNKMKLQAIDDLKEALETDDEKQDSVKGKVKEFIERL